MTIAGLKEFCLLPERDNQFGTATHSFERPNRMNAKIGKCFGAGVGKLMVLPVSPQILNRIQLRSVGRQGLKRNPAILLGHKVSNQPTSVNGSPVPDDHEITVDVAHQMGEEVNDLGTSDTAGIQPKVKSPPRHSRNGRERLPVKRVLKHRRLPSRRPGSTTVGTLAEPAFVDKYYRTALPLGFF